MVTVPRLRSLFYLISVLALIAGAALLAYGQWSKPLLEADRAAQAHDQEGALRAYGISVTHFRDRTAMQQLLRDDYARVVHNQLAILYRTGQYESVIDTAGSAPVDAAPHFWVGCAMFAKSLQEDGAEGQLQWLTRAEDEFKLALAAEPGDWDTKYNYELSARLVAALRRPPKPGNKPSAIKLLRPEGPSQPREGMKKVG
jgi:hypothetical protein